MHGTPTRPTLGILHYYLKLKDKIVTKGLSYLDAIVGMPVQLSSFLPEAAIYHSVSSSCSFSVNGVFTETCFVNNDYTLSRAYHERNK